MRFTRSKNRDDNKIKSDIIATTKITRDDIEDFLKGKDKKTRASELKSFLESIPDSGFSGEKKLSIDKIMKDLPSYE